jgi:ankyrin repeat protein
MISRFDRNIPAMVCVGAALVLIGCKKSSSDGSAESSAAEVSLNTTSQNASATSKANVTSISAPGDQAATATTQPTLVSDKHIVVAEPAILELGQIPTGESKVGTVTLMNKGDQPMKLGRPKSSCGCTAVQKIAGEMIQPGESRDVEINMKGGTAQRDLNKTVTFIVEGQPPLVVRVNASAVSFVEVEPAVIGPEATPDGVITLKSIDDQPFTVINMLPPVLSADAFSTEPSSEVQVTIPWERFKELGMRHKVVFDTDHPKCQKVYVTVQFDRSNPEYVRQPPKPPVQPVGRSSAASLVSNYITNGQTADVVKMIEVGDVQIESRDASGATLLNQAAKAGQVELVNALIEAGADVEAPDKAGRTPLMAASEGKNADVIFTLLDAGASLEARDNIGGTAVSWAAAFGDPESVIALIDAGADVRVVGTATGYTPLIWASGFGQSGSVEALLEVGAQVETADLLEGLTPLMHAARTGKVESIQVLLDNGAEVEAKDRIGRTALLTAAANTGGTVEKIQVLVEAGADINAKDKRGEGALALSRRRSDEHAAAVVEYLESVSQ